MEMKFNPKRVIRERIYINTADAEYGLKTIAAFIANKMKTCDKIIFQSDFGFMNTDVPFAIMIERLDPGVPNFYTSFKVSYISADWQFYLDKIWTDVTDPHPTKIETGSWITSDELTNTVFDPEKQTTDPYDYFMQNITYGHSEDVHAIDLRDSLYEWLSKEYDLTEYDDDDDDEFVNYVGGFIVCETEKGGTI